VRTGFRPGKCRYSQTDNDGRGEAGLSMSKHQETGQLNKGGRNHFVTWRIPINSFEAEKEKGRRGFCFVFLPYFLLGYKRRRQVKLSGLCDISHCARALCDLEKLPPILVFNQPCPTIPCSLLLEYATLPLSRYTMCLQGIYRQEGTSFS